MNTYTLGGNRFRELITNGCANLRANYKIVDALNVFPVPDGDTGINMTMTIEAGINEIGTSDNDNISEVADALSHAMLFGARGNSGVILSQFWRGFFRGLASKSEVNAKEFGEAMQGGVNQAYKAVVNPQEGTILTVCREATAKANELVKDGASIEEYLDLFLKEADESLQRTPDLLPVLKEAGVVDSGATGYIYIIEGMRKALEGEYIHYAAQTQAPSAPRIKNTFTADSELTFGYCTEFILQLQNKKVDIKNFDVNIIIDYMLSIGDSLVCVMDDGIVKVHVHTREPYKVLQFGQQFGEFITIKIENMQIQHSETTVSNDASAQCNCPECVAAREKAQFKKWAVVTVANGKGLEETFKEMGADYVVVGGQTMNPSSEDFVKGFDTINAENIIVFPNNGNIILAAEQASKIYDKCNVYVIPTKSISQGYSALAMLDVSSDDIETIKEDLQAVIDNVTSGSVTYSIRDAEIDGVVIKKDDLMAICNGKIIGSCKTSVDAAKMIIDAGMNDDKELVTIFYGEDASLDDANELVDYINEKYPDVECEVLEGGQAVYHFILSIE